MTLTTSKTHQVTVNIPDEMIEELITTAFEGGINYWAKEVNILGISKASRSYQITDAATGEKHWFTEEKIAPGLTKMAAKYPQHFSSILTGDTDVETADVFIQCCLFGEVRYG